MDGIKFLVMDVDGTLTDGKIYMGVNGETFKAFNIKDGYGIHDILPQLGVTPIILTGRKNKILLKRCQELGIKHHYQGVYDKLDKLKEVLMSFSKNGNIYNLKNVAYCGDDCNDLSCMIAVKNCGGVVGCPKDAVSQVQRIADFISEEAGGCGAVRAFIEWIREREACKDERDSAN